MSRETEIAQTAEIEGRVPSIADQIGFHWGIASSSLEELESNLGSVEETVNFLFRLINPKNNTYDFLGYQRDINQFIDNNPEDKNGELALCVVSNYITCGQISEAVNATFIVSNAYHYNDRRDHFSRSLIPSMLHASRVVSAINPSNTGGENQFLVEANNLITRK